MMTWLFGKTAYNALQSVWRSAHALRENFHVAALANPGQHQNKFCHFPALPLITFLGNG